MTVGEAGKSSGILNEVIRETKLDTDEPLITLKSAVGELNPDLTVGVDVTLATGILANAGVASMGPALGERGFVIDTTNDGLFAPSREKQPWLRRLTIGKDITEHHRNRHVIDVREYPDENALRDALPKVYQHLKQTVYPLRATNNDPKLREFWWRFRRSNDIYF